MHRKVTLFDYSDYVSEKSCNGGHYGFWTDFTLRSDGLYEVSYGTTADFVYCPCCGQFGCEDCEDYETVTEKELNAIIERFKKNAIDGQYVKYYD